MCKKCLTYWRVYHSLSKHNIFNRCVWIVWIGIICNELFVRVLPHAPAGVPTIVWKSIIIITSANNHLFSFK